jgi:hypothetical protein
MNARGKAKMGPIPWPDIKERRKAGLSAYDPESKTWRIVEICDEPIAMKRSREREIETGEPCGITLYGKNDIPQIGERVWPA